MRSSPSIACLALSLIACSGPPGMSGAGGGTAATGGGSTATGGGDATGGGAGGGAETDAGTGMRYAVAGHRVVTTGVYKNDDGNPVTEADGGTVPLSASVWYPTTAAGASHTYILSYPEDGGTGQRVTSSDVALDAPVAPGRFPLILFAHGDSGCGAQSVFITEELARRGYIVIGPDYNDARCSEGAAGALMPGANPVVCPGGVTACFTGIDPGLLPSAAGQTTYRSWRYRYFESEDALSWALTGASGLAGAIAKDATDAYVVGAVGHSLGGYTVFGLLGGWPSWKDTRIRAGVLLSPWIVDKLPSKVNLLGNTVPVGDPANWLADPMNTLQSTNLPRDYVKVPVMFQGGDRDNQITPWVCAQGAGTCTWPGGGFTNDTYPGGGLAWLTNGIAPTAEDTWFVLFGGNGGVNHYDWSNAQCNGAATTQECLATSVTAQDINRFTQGFLAQYVAGRPDPDLALGYGATADRVPVFYEKVKGGTTVTDLRK